MSIEHRPDRPGKPWRVRWREEGSNRSQSFRTKREAVAFEAAVEQRRALGAHASPAASPITLSEWLDRWTDTYGPQWADSTQSQREHTCDKYIEPFLGAVRLRDLGRARIQTARRDMIAGQLTPKTVNASIRVLSAALSAATEEGLIPANPCLNLRSLPTTPTDRTAVPRDVVEAVRSAVPTHRDRLMVSILAYAGLRPGELVALQQTDVDSGFITIRHSIGPGGLKGTKTGKVRTVPIRPEVERDLAGYEYPKSGRLVEGERGAPVDWNNWGERVWRGTCKPLGFKYPPYSLRHTYASLLIAEGHTVVEVAAWMGHSNANTTLSHYAHLFARAPKRT